MRYLMFILVWLMLGAVARADMLSIDALNIDFIKFFPHGRAPLITDNGLDNKEPGERLGLDATVSTLGVFYWYSRVEGTTDHNRDSVGGQFRSVGLEMELGLRLTDQIDGYYYHHSQHTLDTTYPQGFPVVDGIGFRMRLIQPGKRDSVL